MRGAMATRDKGSVINRRRASERDVAIRRHRFSLFFFIYFSVSYVADVCVFQWLRRAAIAPLMIDYHCPGFSFFLHFPMLIFAIHITLISIEFSYASCRLIRFRQPATPFAS
jgi:hypothetical protein